MWAAPHPDLETTLTYTYSPQPCMPYTYSPQPCMPYIWCNGCRVPKGHVAILLRDRPNPLIHTVAASHIYSPTVCIFSVYCHHHAGNGHVGKPPHPDLRPSPQPCMPYTYSPTVCLLLVYCHQHAGDGHVGKPPPAKKGRIVTWVDGGKFKETTFSWDEVVSSK